ncbi:MAG TPA: glycoside hydrolase family 3 N-terminal domain-containing protein [Magnetospirillaceae bacterium]|nr:glycoside hydrolase family 3 N-terminal domain-containing protein [Magnetospirillaceae bacterium]
MMRGARTLIPLASAALLGVAAVLSSLSAQAAAGYYSPLPPEEPRKEPQERPRDFWSLSGEEESALALLDSLSDEEVLGQILMLTYPGDDPPPLLYQWIARRALGGVKIFGWNADDTVVLASAIRGIQEAAALTAHRIPPFIATDQEGGWIRHVKGATSVTPGNMAIGATARPSDAYKSALFIGRELAALGITMNFAPTVDLALRPRGFIIGPRAFSADPAASAAFGAAYVRGMKDAGILATAKHFPGHGDTELDSHVVLPVIPVDESTLWDRDLIPYRLMVAEGLSGVMTGHLAFPMITGDRTPASLSPRLIEGILRGRMGFEGLVVTDDLFMSGAVLPGGFPETSKRAIMAGNDMLVVSRILDLADEAWNRLIQAYRTDEAFRKRVRESALRILRAKQAYLLPKGPAGLIPRAENAANLQSQASRAFFTDHAFRSATVLEGSGLPLVPGAGGRILLVGSNFDFFSEGLRRYPGAETLRISVFPGPEVFASEAEVLATRARGARAVIVSVANASGARMARTIAGTGVPVYIVSILSPAHALDAGPAAGSVAVYSMSRASFEAAFAVLSGVVEGRGILPISRVP